MSVAQQQLFILVNSKRHSSCLPQPPFPITFKIQGSAASPSRSLSAAPGTGQREIQGHPLAQTTYSHYPGNPAGMPETNTEPLSRPQRATRTLTLSPLGKNTRWKRLNEGKHRKTMLFKSVWARWQECLARRIDECLWQLVPLADRRGKSTSYSVAWMLICPCGRRPNEPGG